MEEISNKKDSSVKKITDSNASAIKISDAVNSKSSSDSEDIAEIDDLESVVKSVTMPEDLKQKALRSIERLRRMARRGSYSGEFETVEKYTDWIVKIPWGKYTSDNLDLIAARERLNSTHHGIDIVKDLIIDYLAVMKLKAESSQQMNQELPKAPIMLFTGLQGLGKTTIAKSIADSMGRQFYRIAVGAIGSVQALRGQSKAFLDAEPGQVIKALTRCGSMNPVIVLDEIDKASGNSGLLNDIMAALLEILDPEQNHSFMDHYVDYPVDLSKVFFICTSNSVGSLSTALLDRMEVIRFTSYSDQEKEVIAKKHTIPNVLKNSGLKPEEIVITDNVWPLLIRPVGFDAGLRQLERNLSVLARRVVRKKLEGAALPITITQENLREFVIPDQGPLS